MKRKLFKLFSVVVLATLTIALTACSGDKETASSSSITIGIPQDMEDSLDPTKAVAAGTKEIYFNIFTIDGKVVRQNVKSAEGLDSGIYIVNGKKMIVK